jgi:hypothetical protein
MPKHLHKVLPQAPHPKIKKGNVHLTGTSGHIDFNHYEISPPHNAEMPPTEGDATRQRHRLGVTGLGTVGKLP